MLLSANTSSADVIGVGNLCQKAIMPQVDLVRYFDRKDAYVSQIINIDIGIGFGRQCSG